MTSPEHRPVVGPETPVPSPSQSPEARSGHLSRKTAHVTVIGDQLKVAEVESRSGKRFRLYSDEPPSIGGQDEHPQPLSYLVAAVGF